MQRTVEQIPSIGAFVYLCLGLIALLGLLEEYYSHTFEVRLPEQPSVGAVVQTEKSQLKLGSEIQSRALEPDSVPRFSEPLSTGVRATVAQEDMAFWTAVMAVVALLGLFVSAGALYALLETLKKTSESVKQIKTANELSSRLVTQNAKIVEVNTIAVPYIDFEMGLNARFEEGKWDPKPSHFKICNGGLSTFTVTRITRFIQDVDFKEEPVPFRGKDATKNRESPENVKPQQAKTRLTVGPQGKTDALRSFFGRSGFQTEKRRFWQVVVESETVDGQLFETSFAYVYNPKSKEQGVHLALNIPNAERFFYHEPLDRMEALSVQM